jgi:hypothetical protein
MKTGLIIIISENESKEGKNAIKRKVRMHLKKIFFGPIGHQSSLPKEEKRENFHQNLGLCLP